MIRVVLFLILVGVLAFGTVWLADRPGDVVVTWQGWHIETSVMVAALGLVLLIAIVMLVWSIIRAILHAPKKISASVRRRRGERGFDAVSRGLVAIGSGDARTARKMANDARRIAPNEPLTLLLTAQAAQLSGDRTEAEQTFRAMANREDTKALGLHGLFMEAQRRGDLAAAQFYAEEATKAAPVPEWAGDAALAFRCAASDWSGALDRLDRNMKSGLIDKAAHRRQRAVLLTAKALTGEANDRDAAKTAALEAVKDAPTLVPAAALAGRLVSEDGDVRRAARIIETAWKANPHPDLAEAYVNLRKGDSARDRFARIETLAKLNPNNVEAALATARAALDAQEFTAARSALAPYIAEPSQRVAMLMAEIESREHGDEGRAREWLARSIHAKRDPTWTADGIVSERWIPISPVSGKLDAFEWKVPVTPIQLPGPVIENRRDLPQLSAASETAQTSDPAHIPEPPAAKPAPDAAGSPADPASQAAPSASSAPAADANGAEERPPLDHPPDDPGPGADVAADPQPRSGPAPDGWQKMRQMFK